MLTWVHVGDLHASDEDGWESVRLLHQICGEANRHLAGAVDFAVLPGDNANHGQPDQYRRLHAALDDLALRWFVIPGDHDFEPKTLDNFYAGLGAPKLPLSAMVKGHRCLFLDIISPGTGGPDFRLGASQTDWLKDQLAQSTADSERPVVFMHAFPADLAEGGEALAALFADRKVAAIDTGHTHYNEVLNDGGAIYTATRSTGQIEEGPAGFSLHAVDGPVTSWRFKPLQQPWPFVLITAPADRRLALGPDQSDQARRGPFAVRAKVFGDDVAHVSLTVDDGAPIAMTPVAGAAGLWTAEAGALEGRRTLTVAATASAGIVDRDSIEIDPISRADPAKRGLKPRTGDHVHTIGAWPERGLLGTQLGPNKNGTIKW